MDASTRVSAFPPPPTLLRFAWTHLRTHHCRWPQMWAAGRRPGGLLGLERRPGGRAGPVAAWRLYQPATTRAAGWGWNSDQKSSPPGGGFGGCHSRRFQHLRAAGREPGCLLGQQRAAEVQPARWQVGGCHSRRLRRRPSRLLGLEWRTSLQPANVALLRPSQPAWHTAADSPCWGDNIIIPAVISL